MVKKYFIWSSAVATIGLIATIFLFKVASFSYAYVDNFLYSKGIIEHQETDEDIEEIIINEVVPITPQTENYTISQKVTKTQSAEVKKDIKIGVTKKQGTINGISMFRGNLTRTWYGEDLSIDSPQTLWKYPEDPMCGLSTSAGKESLWCGTGWTGQPVVWEKDTGETEIIFGAYDGAVHFINAQNGKEVRNSFQTNDIIKGSVTLDPDGFPLLYFGSRDNKLRILSLDQETPVELWALDSKDLGGMWNNDWDGNPAIIDDVLYEGGENGWFYAIKLNREINKIGNVTVDPKIVFSMPSYTQELIDQVGRNVSIENSPAFFENRVYFANSGGRVIGLDISKIETGVAPIVFDYWVGDDVDATIIIDEGGMLYVSVEQERFNERSKELGQFIKLNPYSSHDPYVWGIHVSESVDVKDGIWATPALYKDYLFTTTHGGRLIEVNKKTGDIVWEEKIAPHAWSSPVVVDDTLLIGTCDGKLLTYSLKKIENPVLQWSHDIGNGTCIESTPLVWKNQIFIGSRDGYFYSVGEKQ
jgi:outer membrane protein assembly factor BamB